MTGISASWARFSESSQPAPSVADSRITSTPSSTNDVNASICDFWSRLVAGAYLRSKPFSLLNVSCMFASLAARQAPSGPTATKPTEIGSPVDGALPADAVVAAEPVESGAEVAPEPESSSSPQAAKPADTAEDGGQRERPLEALSSDHQFPPTFP